MAAAVAIVALSIGLFSAVRNGRGWKSRATAAEHKAAGLTNDLATTRANLGKQTEQNDTLNRRITELTNEKAQVQDERNAAQEAAKLGMQAISDVNDCYSDLLDQIGSTYVYTPASCDAAERSVSAFAAAVRS